MKPSRFELALTVYHHFPVSSPVVASSDALSLQRQSSVVESAEAREGSRAHRQWEVSMNWGVVMLVVQFVPVRMQRFVDMVTGMRWKGDVCNERDMLGYLCSDWTKADALGASGLVSRRILALGSSGAHEQVRSLRGSIGIKAKNVGLRWDYE